MQVEMSLRIKLRLQTVHAFFVGGSSQLDCLIPWNLVVSFLEQEGVVMHIVKSARKTEQCEESHCCCNAHSGYNEISQTRHD